VVLVRVPGKLIEKLSGLQSADTIECGIAPSEADSQCPARASAPEAAGRRRRIEAIQQRNGKVWKFCKDNDAISILWSSVRSLSMVESKKHLYLWVYGNTVVVICFEDVGRDCEDVVNGDTLLTLKGGWLRNNGVKTVSPSESRRTATAREEVVE
jgi:hypothetical protein